MDELLGIPIHVSNALPATVRDAQGREVELVGVLYDPRALEDWLRGWPGEPTAAPRIVLLTGRLVGGNPNG